MSELFADPIVRKSIDVDLALLERYDDLITDLELTIVRDAKRHDGDAVHRLRSVPGIAKCWRSRFSMRSTTFPALIGCRNLRRLRAW